MDWLPQSLEWLTGVGIILAAAAFLVTNFGKFFRLLRKEKDESEEKLITILQGTVTALEKKQEDNVRSITELRGRVTELETKNKIITDVFQGRDEGTVAFQRAGFEAIKRTEEILNLSIDNNKHIVLLFDAMKQIHEDIAKVLLIPNQSKQID